jgi:diguanylate cyclase (GGDEF)-like protein
LPGHETVRTGLVQSFSRENAGMKITPFPVLWSRLRKENFYWMIGFYALSAAAIVHLLFIPLFWILDLPFLSAFNVLSVLAYWYAIFGLGMQAMERRDDRLIGWIVYVELILHNLLASYYLGTCSGFQLYIYALVLLPFFVFTYSRPIYLLRISVVILLSLAIDRMSVFHYPKVPVSEVTIQWLHTFNLFIFLGILGLLSYLYAVHSKAHHDLLEHSAHRDMLTGLYNRRFISRFSEKFSAGEEPHGDGKRLGVLLGDIDRFKELNDTYGHDCGDRAIDHVATLLSKHLGDATVARWGGEEFLILFERTDSVRLYRRAEELRKIIESEPVECGGKSIPVTITFGGTVERRGEGFAELLKLADLALYEGKKSGRNCSVVR